MNSTGRACNAFTQKHCCVVSVCGLPSTERPKDSFRYLGVEYLTDQRCGWLNIACDSDLVRDFQCTGMTKHCYMSAGGCWMWNELAALFWGIVFSRGIGLCSQRRPPVSPSRPEGSAPTCTTIPCSAVEDGEVEVGKNGHPFHLSCDVSSDVCWRKVRLAAPRETLNTALSTFLLQH